MGECSLDTLLLVDGLPRPGDKVDVDERLDLPGGQVATAMRACGRLGLRAGLIGAVGDDEAADAVLAPLAAAGIDVHGVRRLAGLPTRSAIVLVDRAGERTVLGHRAPGLVLAPGDLRREEIVRAAVLHVDASDLDASIWAAGVAQADGIPVVLDVDAVVPGIERLLPRIDFPVVSLDFADEYGGEGGPWACIERLVAGGARYAVVTLGSRGAIGGAEPGAQVPAFDVPVRDTTGAGDVFHAGFVYALVRGLDAGSALHVAGAAAALSCGGLGAQGALPDAPQLEALLADDASPAGAVGGPTTGGT